MLGRRRAGDSGAGSEVSSVEMNLDAAEGDGNGAGDGDATDEMMIDDMDDIFKPVSATNQASAPGTNRDIAGPSSSSGAFSNVPSGDVRSAGVSIFYI